MDSIFDLPPFDTLNVVLVGLREHPAGLITLERPGEVYDLFNCLEFPYRVLREEGSKVSSFIFSPYLDQVNELCDSYQSKDHWKTGRLLGIPDILIEAFGDGAKLSPLGHYLKQNQQAPSWTKFVPCWYVNSLNCIDQMDVAQSHGERYELIIRETYPDLHKKLVGLLTQGL